MNTENYEQTQAFRRSILGTSVNYLIPNVVFSIEIFEGQPVGVRTLP